MTKQCSQSHQSSCAHGSALSPEEMQLRSRMHDIDKKILVLSGKGGVGKSTVAANLAMSLARLGKTVGLLDVDIHGPSIARLMGLADTNARMIGYDGEITPVQVMPGLSVVSMAFLLQNDNEAVIWRGPRKHSVIRQFLAEVSWGKLDYLIVDSPPGTGDEPLAVAQSVGDRAAAVIVTTPQQLAVSDVRRCITFCKQLNLPIVGIVENMSGYLCPHCRESTDIFAAGGGFKLAVESGVPLLGKIPIDPLVTLGGDAGKPFVTEHTDTPIAAAFAAIVEQVEAYGRPQPVTTHKTPGNKESLVTQDKTMIIAIPLAEGRLCMHFGHCEQFALLSVDPQKKAITGKQLLTPPPHEPGVLPRWLHEQGVNAIIAGGMGSRAQALFAEQEIKVLVGAPVDEPEVLVTAYLAGNIETGGNTCDH